MSIQRNPGSSAQEGPYSEAYTRYVLGIILLVSLFNNMDRTVLSILVEPIRREFDLSDTGMGALMGPAFVLVYTLTSLPVARWADVGVRRSIIALGLFLWSGFTAATSLAQSYLQLFAMRMGVGIGEAAGTPPSLSLLSDYVPPGKRAGRLSVISIGAVVGMGAGMILGGWVEERYGWRMAFVAAGLPGILLALIVRLSVREAPRGGSEGSTRSLERPSVMDALRYLLSLRTYRFILLANAFSLFASMGRNLWEPTFIIRTYDMGTSAAGTWYFLTSPLPSMLGIYLGGRLADRLGARDARWYLRIPALGQVLSVPLLIGFILWPESHRLSIGPIELPFAFVLSIAGSVLGSFFTAPFLATIQSISRLRIRAFAAAVSGTVSSFVGLFAGPLLVGLLSDSFNARFGEEALRYSLLVPTSAPLLAAVVCLKGARSVPGDLARVREEAS
jgi:MFS family permease